MLVNFRDINTTTTADLSLPIGCYWLIFMSEHITGGSCWQWVPWQKKLGSLRVLLPCGFPVWVVNFGIHLRVGGIGHQGEGPGNLQKGAGGCLEPSFLWVFRGINFLFLGDYVPGIMTSQEPPPPPPPITEGEAWVLQVLRLIAEPLALRSPGGISLALELGTCRAGCSTGFSILHLDGLATSPGLPLPAV